MTTATVDSVLDLLETYQKHTGGDPAAASNLVLAHVQLERRQKAAVDDSYTAAQVAQIVNCSTRAVYRLCTAGKLEHYRIGTGRQGIRITAKSVQSFVMESKRGEPETGQPSRFDQQLQEFESRKRKKK